MNAIENGMTEQVVVKTAQVDKVRKRGIFGFATIIEGPDTGVEIYFNLSEHYYLETGPIAPIFTRQPKKVAARPGDRICFVQGDVVQGAKHPHARVWCMESAWNRAESACGQTRTAINGTKKTIPCSKQHNRRNKAHVQRMRPQNPRHHNGEPSNHWSIETDSRDPNSPAPKIDLNELIK